MKKSLFIFLGLSLLLYSCSPQILPYLQSRGIRPSPTLSSAKMPFDAGWDDPSFFQGGLAPDYQDAMDGLPGASIYHLALAIAEHPSRVSGIEEILYTNQEPAALTEVEFAVYPEILGGSINIQEAVVNDQPVAASHQDGLLRIPLTVPLVPKESIVIHLEFSIEVPERGGNFYYGIFGYNDSILSLAQAYPTILVYNEHGWNDQTPDLNGDPLFADISFYLVSVDAPADLVLAASGTELSRSVTGDRQQVLYADGPARDFYLAASTGFTKITESAAGVTFNSYAVPGTEDKARSALGFAEAAITDFSRRYAAYPYSEFDIVPIDTSAGGVEFPGLAAIATFAYPNDNYLEIAVVHEVAHQWFYNLVGNATQEQPWLDESMAQFLTCQYYKDRYGLSAEKACEDELRNTWWGSVNERAIPVGLPVSAYNSISYPAIIYGRGPLFLFALRDQMGIDVFDRFIRDYTQHYEWSIANTNGFKQIAEQTCACNLEALFNDWIYP
jgi:hypothetical protein